MGGAVVDNATVTINGTSLTWTDPVGGFPGGYLDYTINIAAGNPVILSVTAGANTASATLTMPVLPGVTAPTTLGGPYDASAGLAVTWTLATEPDEVVVGIDSDYTVSGDDYEETLLGSATNTTIPAGTLKTGPDGSYGGRSQCVSHECHNESRCGCRYRRVQRRICRGQSVVRY